MSDEKQASFDLVVIGSGPGGYVAAIRAAQLGLSVACIERESLGGICLNWGCIPTKALLRSAEVLDLARRAREFGVIAKDVSYDFGAMVERSRGVSTKISRGVAFLFKKNKITHIPGSARLGGAGLIHVESESGKRSVRAEHIILATGARARSLPGIELDGERIIAYREAMTLPRRPESMIIVGAGAIGVEFASFYSSIDTVVTLVEYLPRLVPNEDKDISTELARAFKKRGIAFHTGAKLSRADVVDGKVKALIEPAQGGGALSELVADVLLMAVGIAGNVESMGLEEVGVVTQRGLIQVDEHYRTAVKNVYAIGDVVGRMALAHVASAEGVYVAELIAGKHPHAVRYDAVPACTYCHPEIASVGLTEEKAAEAGIEVKVGRFPFGPLGKTVAAGEYPGFAKFIWDASNGALVGAHLIGPAVTDLIASPTLAKTTEVNAESFIHTIHAHPTFAEALKEAAEDAYGMAIHI
ncbi:MAG TPA: dihydrolipoyl dehydrogenase [Kofleriaceae bacterium]|nr:dihydrolipoyl dehydrogenase [Kofleriaceae bacterium]